MDVKLFVYAEIDGLPRSNVENCRTSKYVIWSFCIKTGGRPWISSLRAKRNWWKEKLMNVRMRNCIFYVHIETSGRPRMSSLRAKRNWWKEKLMNVRIRNCIFYVHIETGGRPQLPCCTSIYKLVDSTVTCYTPMQKLMDVHGCQVVRP